MEKILLLFLLCVSINAQTNYTDDFATQPFNDNPAAFTTGTTSVGLSYVSTNCIYGFAYDNTYKDVNIVNEIGDAASFSISARDGKSFYFNSIYITNTCGPIVISGSGYQPFTINVGNTSGSTFSPSGGPKLVTSVTFVSVAPHDFSFNFDNVSTSLGYSLLSFNNGSGFTQNIIPNSLNQVLGRLQLSSNSSGAILTSASIKLNNPRTGLSNLKLWSSSDAVFSSSTDTQLGSTIPVDPGVGNSISFSFLSPVSTSTTYYFLTGDVSASSTGTVQGVIVQNSSLTLTGGIIAGTISNEVLSDNATPLPVELVSFKGLTLDNQVILNWQTATEVNNYGFEVEKKAGITEYETENQPIWETVGFVKGNGNSNSQRSYSFIDKFDGSSKIKYRLKQIDNSGEFEYSHEIEVIIDVPKELLLEQNFPNPFNPTTKIRWQSPVDSRQILKVYDILGKEVMTLMDEYKDAGTYEIEFNANELNSGLYFYKITTGEYTETRKMVLLR